jgi:hypothetical protein
MAADVSRTPDQITIDRIRLDRHIADLKQELKLAEAALEALKPGRGRKKGTRLESGDHNFSATREAFNVLQKFENSQRKKGLSIRLSKGEKERIINAACKNFPKASFEQVSYLFDRHRKWDEKKWTNRGYIMRLRGPDYL